MSDGDFKCSKLLRRRMLGVVRIFVKLIGYVELCSCNACCWAMIIEIVMSFNWMVRLWKKECHFSWGTCNCESNRIF